MARVYIGMGSNLGDRGASLAQAADRLARQTPGVKLISQSPIYETEPVGPVSQERYLNAVALLETDLQPTDLLAVLRDLERRAGRAPESHRVRWGPRELDLDILLYDDRVIESGNVIIPHPRMHERWFVLKPLSELAPELIHPVLGKTIRELLAGLEKNTG